MIWYHAVAILVLNFLYVEQQGPVSAGPGGVIAVQIHGNNTVRAYANILNAVYAATLHRQ